MSYIVMSFTVVSILLMAAQFKAYQEYIKKPS